MSTHRNIDLLDINIGSSVRDILLKSAYYTEESIIQSKDIKDYITYLSDELNQCLIFVYTWNQGPYHCSAALSVKHTLQLFCNTVAWKKGKVFLNTFSTYTNQFS